MRTIILLLAAMFALLVIPGCGVVDERADHPLPAAQAPTSSQAAVEQQLANEHDRRLRLEALLGAPAKTLAQSDARVVKAEALVKEMQAGNVKDAAEIASAKGVLADERAKNRDAIAEAKLHTARLAELTLFALSILSALLAYWIAGERMKLLGFSAACLGGIAGVIFIEAVLPYVTLIVTTGVLGGGLWLLAKHVSLAQIKAEYHAVVTDIAAHAPQIGFQKLEGAAKDTWAKVVSAMHGPRVVSVLARVESAAKTVETDVAAIVKRGVAGSTSHTVAANIAPADADVVKFGADPSGIADSTAAFAAAAASLAPAGGRLVAGNGGTFKLAIGWAPPPFVTVYGISIVH